MFIKGRTIFQSGTYSEDHITSQLIRKNSIYYIVIGLIQQISATESKGENILEVRIFIVKVTELFNHRTDMYKLLIC